MIDFKNNTVSLDLFKRVLKEIKNTDRAIDIIDSFSDNQFISKRKLITLIEELDILDKESEVIIFGCWYGSILIPTLCNKVKKITGMDLDEYVLNVAKNNFFKNTNNLEFIVGDVFEKNLSRYRHTNLIINTSCEHMPSMHKWPFWKYFKSNSYFAFQSNNMDKIEGHINCVYSLDEFKQQLPDYSEILVEDELRDDRGIRYTIIGKLA